MFEAYKIGVAIHLTNHVSGGLSTIMRDFATTEAQAASLQKRLDSIALGMKGGLIAMGVGAAMAAAFKPAIDDAMKFERAMLRLKDIGGIDVKVLTQVRSDALSGKYKGIGAAESVDLVRDLHAAFGDAKEALEFMPLFTGMARVTQGKYGKSAVQGEEDVRALAKVAERRGGTKSPAAMESAMDLAMKIQNASGGAVTPKDLLAFMNRMGAMGNSMSNDGVMKMWALMQEQGGSKAGTALNSALQNLVNGRGTEGAGFELRKFGLVDEAKQKAYLQSRWGADWAKHVNKISPDAIVDADLARTDTVGWVQKNLIPKLDVKLDAMGITDATKRDMQKSAWIATMFSNRTGADSAALMATQLVRIMKDFHIAGGSAGLRESVKSFDDSPMAKFQELHAKYETALVNLGLGALPVVIPLVNRLAAAFKTFNEYAQQNPGKVKLVVGGLLALSAALFTLGAATVVVNGVRALGLGMEMLKAVSWASTASGLTGVARSLGWIGAALIAWEAGWKVGTWLYEAVIQGTKFSDWLGGLIARVLAFMGNKEAAAAIEGNKSPEERKMDAAKLAAQKKADEAYWRGANQPVTFAKLFPWATTSKPQSPVISAAASANPSQSATQSQQRNVSLVPPPPERNATAINNTIVMPNGEVLARVVTKEQARGMARPPSGTNFVDGSMSPVSVAYAGR